MILKGNEDLRVIKTIEGIKSAFEDLICEKDFAKITTKELCDRARINKKTFYHYYSSLDALLVEMQLELSSEYLKRIQAYHLPEDLDKVNRAFFEYSSEQGIAYEKITCSETYRPIRDEMVTKVVNEGWGKSKHYQRLNEYEKRFLISFINSAVLGAYKQWIEDDKRQKMEDVIEITNRIVLGGVNGFFTSHR